MMEPNFKVNMNEYLPLRDVVFNTLRQAILRGELKPGERLMEIQLANKPVSYTHLSSGRYHPVFCYPLPYNNVSSFNSSARAGLKASFLKRQLQLSEAVPGMFMRAVEP